MRRGREARYRATGSDWAEHEATGLGDASDGFVGSVKVSSDMGVLGAMGRVRRAGEFRTRQRGVFG